jgi:hypothetical protein
MSRTDEDVLRILQLPSGYLQVAIRIRTRESSHNVLIPTRKSAGVFLLNLNQGPLAIRTSAISSLNGANRCRVNPYGFGFRVAIRHILAIGAHDFERLPVDGSTTSF